MKSEIPFVTNMWHHVSLVYDPVGPNITYYINNSTYSVPLYYKRKYPQGSGGMVLRRKDIGMTDDLD